MRSYVSLAASLAVALVLLAACSPRDTSAPASNATAQNATSKSATKPEQPAADDVRRVTRDELRAGMERGEVVIFDVRDKVSYESGHIKGAKLVPWGEVADRLAEFPKDKLIVTYCA